MSAIVAQGQHSLFRRFNLENFAVFSIFFLALSLPLSTSLSSIAGVMIVICCVLIFSYKRYYSAVGISILLLFFWYGLRALYSIGEMREIEQHLHKVARILVIPLLACFLASDRRRLAVLIAFSVTTVGTIIAAMYKGHVLCKDNIITSLFVAYSIFILAHLCYEHRRWIWFVAPMAALLTYYLFFIGTGRSGQLIFLCLAVLFCWQRLRKNILFQVFGVFTLAVVIIASIVFPSSFIARQKVALVEIQNYSMQHEDQVPHTSSMGVRFILIHNAWELIKQKPIFGWGTGAFRQAYANNAPEGQFTKESRTNPHNQYLAAWVETGVVGLALLLVFFATLLSTFFREKNLFGYLGTGLVLSYIAGCFANSWLYDVATAYLFILICAVCLSSVSRQQKIY